MQRGFMFFAKSSMFKEKFLPGGTILKRNAARRSYVNIGFAGRHIIKFAPAYKARDRWAIISPDFSNVSSSWLLVYVDVYYTRTDEPDEPTSHGYRVIKRDLSLSLSFFVIRHRRRSRVLNCANFSQKGMRCYRR